MNYNPSGFSICEILQARILERVAISSSTGSSWPRDWTCVSCTVGGFFTAELPGEAYFVECPSICISLVFSLVRLGSRLLEKKRSVLHIISHRIRSQGAWQQHDDTGDVGPRDLVLVALARFLQHGKVPLFPFQYRLEVLLCFLEVEPLRP